MPAVLRQEEYGEAAQEDSDVYSVGLRVLNVAEWMVLMNVYGEC